MVVAGIDVGSTTVKCVVMKGGEILATKVASTGYDMSEAWGRVLYPALEEAGVKKEDVDRIVSTGYGRECVAEAHRQVTEITCHGKGAHFLSPEVRTVIDIGGQDSKAISLDEGGKVLDFVMNDRCAAGTGRFLEVMSRALGVDMERFGELSLSSSNPVSISSVCTVFAESEVISMMAHKKKREDIIAGIHRAIASRIFSMTRRLRIQEPIMLTGGCARNVGLKKALEDIFSCEIVVHELSQLTGAIGAALMARS